MTGDSAASKEPVAKGGPSAPEDDEQETEHMTALDHLEHWHGWRLVPQTGELGSAMTGLGRCAVALTLSVLFLVLVGVGVFSSVAAAMLAMDHGGMTRMRYAALALVSMAASAGAWVVRAHMVRRGMALPLRRSNAG